MHELALLALIANAEAEFGIPKNLLQALCTVESNLNPNALVEVDGKSGRSSYGACQVQLRVARQFIPSISASQLYSPATNSYVAGAYLKWQFSRYHNWERAVVAYNRGSSRGGGNKYSRKVLAKWKAQNKSLARTGTISTAYERPNLPAPAESFLRHELGE